MLKIKDNIDLKELEKFGFEEGLGEWYFDFKQYTKSDHSYLYIAECDRVIDTDYVEYEDINEMIDKIFDLIQAGFVEKVIKNDN